MLLLVVTNGQKINFNYEFKLELIKKLKQYQLTNYNLL